MRLTFLSCIGAASICLFAAGCDDAQSSETGADETNAAACEDGEDNDGDGKVDCDDADCQSLEICEPEQGAPAADRSGMPVPEADDIPAPSGEVGNLEVLDWAGFEAGVSYTFDDSHPSHIAHYEALNETGVKMTFFVVNATATDTEAWSRVVADGHELGNHTAHHCRAELTDDCAFGSPLGSAEEEIEACSSLITDDFGQEGVWSMASPYGEAWWNAFAQNYVFLNRGVNADTVAPNRGVTAFNLPSVLLPGNASVASLNGYLDSVLDEGEWLIFTFHAILPTGDAGSGGVDIDAIVGSIEHGLGAGTLWMDSMVDIGAYWLGQKIFTAVIPEDRGEKTVWSWTLPDHFPTGRYLRVTVEGGTLSQNGEVIPWSPHGYYEIALDEKELTLSQ